VDFMRQSQDPSMQALTSQVSQQSSLSHLVGMKPQFGHTPPLVRTSVQEVGGDQHLFA
jgi:hypothetical protein